MRKPYAPTKPTEPIKRLELYEIEVELYEDFILSEDNLKKIVEIKLSGFELGNFKNIAYEGEWKPYKIKIESDYDYTGVFLIFTGGKVTYDDPSYDYSYSKYLKELKNYPKKLEQYKEKLVEYDKWKKEQDAKDSIKRIELLKKKIEEDKKLLKKLTK